MEYPELVIRCKALEFKCAALEDQLDQARRAWRAWINANTFERGAAEANLAMALNPKEGRWHTPQPEKLQ